MKPTSIAIMVIFGAGVIAGLFAVNSRSPVDAVAGSTTLATEVASEVRPPPSTHAREEVAGLPAEEPHASDGGNSSDPGRQNDASMQQSLADLRRRIEEPLLGMDLEAAVLEKYRGLAAADLLQIYPFLSDAQGREMMETLEKAIESGNYVSEVVPSGQPVDYDKYKQAGETFQSVASQTESLGNGLVEYRIVAIDRARFPDMYARTFEEIWVHERIDEAGICTICKRSPPDNVQVTVTENR